MRTNLSGNPTFRQFLSRAETALGHIIRMPSRSLSRCTGSPICGHPFFDIFFNHVNVRNRAELGRPQIDLLDVARNSKFPLTVYADDNRQITCVWS
jgi:hypothetical protein